MKKTYVIDLMGCDDSTVFKMDLDETELELVKKIAKKSEELSECRCMPTLHVNEYIEGKWYYGLKKED